LRLCLLIWDSGGDAVVIRLFREYWTRETPSKVVQLRNVERRHCGRAEASYTSKRTFRCKAGVSYYLLSDELINIRRQRLTTTAVRSRLKLDCHSMTWGNLEIDRSKPYHPWRRTGLPVAKRELRSDNEPDTSTSFAKDFASKRMARLR
jgi:hypothetical protein